MTRRLTKALILSLGTAAALVAGTIVAAPAYAAYDDQAIEGTVVVDGMVGAYSGSVSVRFVGTPTDPDSGDETGAIQPDGSFHIGLYEPGSYEVCVEPASRNWAEACWQDGGEIGVVTVGAGETVTGKTINTTQLGGIEGVLLANESGGPTPNGSLIARLFRETPQGYEFVAEAGTGAPFNGKYQFNSIEPGVYALEFAHLAGFFSREYWENARFFPDHTDVTVTAGPNSVLGQAVLAERSYDRLRISGPDRFATAVEISKELFPADGTDVPVIYIASGLNYPDALAAGPAAAYQGGGLLLVTPSAIPAVVAAELDRLDPQRIVVVGGTPSISSGVATALRDYVDSPSDVDRIGGTDRFQTSRLIVQDAWAGDTSAHAFIATGMNFPDALAATPAAGVRGAPIILVSGGSSSLDSATRAVLEDLEVEAIHIVGSAASVSTGIENDLASLVGPDNYIRYSGFNRFATAVLVSIGNFGVADNAFVATGMGFADALAGGPLAAASGSPIYLSDGHCLQDFVLEDIDAVGANRVVLLGSNLTLSNNVYNLGACASTVSNEFSDGMIRIPQG